MERRNGVSIYTLYYELFITLSSFVCHPTNVVVVVINSKPLPKTSTPPPYYYYYSYYYRRPMKRSERIRLTWWHIYLLCQSNVSDRLIVWLYGSDRALACGDFEGKYKGMEKGGKRGRHKTPEISYVSNTITVGDSQQAGNNKGWSAQVISRGSFSHLISFVRVTYSRCGFRCARFGFFSIFLCGFLYCVC